MERVTGSRCGGSQSRPSLPPSPKAAVATARTVLEALYRAGQQATAVAPGGGVVLIAQILAALQRPAAGGGGSDNRG